MNRNILIILLLSQILFWIVTNYYINKYGIKSIWGKTPEYNKKEISIFTILSYILNISLYIYYIFYTKLSKKRENNIILSIIGYYVLLILFYPAMIMKNKLFLKILLFIYIIPVLYLTYDVFKYELNNKKLMTKINLIKLSIIPLYHVIVNDFIRFGLIYH